MSKHTCPPLPTFTPYEISVTGKAGVELHEAAVASRGTFNVTLPEGLLRWGEAMQKLRADRDAWCRWVELHGCCYCMVPLGDDVEAWIRQHIGCATDSPAGSANRG